MNSSKYEDKKILITGGGSGLGQYLTTMFAKQHAEIFIAGRNEAKLHETAEQSKADQDKLHIIPVDIQDETSVAVMFEIIKSKTDKLDLAINNAGIVQVANIDEMPSDLFQRMMGTNLYGAWLCMKHELQIMKMRKQGTIINIAANIGTHTIKPSMGAYGATKAALTVLTKTAALEALPFNVRVHSISPGPLDTDLSYRKGEDRTARDTRIAAANPSKRVGTLREIYETISWLYTSPAYLVGQDIIVDGGASL